MTEWGEWDECSATCGMGMKKRHRMVKMSPADGSMCKAETSQAEKCMMPECREWVWGWERCGGSQHPYYLPSSKTGGWVGAGRKQGPLSVKRTQREGPPLRNTVSNAEVANWWPLESTHLQLCCIGPQSTLVVGEGWSKNFQAGH